MKSLASLAFITFTLAQHAHAVTSQQIHIDLAKTLSSGSEVVSTTDPSYATGFTQRWTVYSKAAPAYDIAVKPATATDVQKIIQYATKNSVPFLATGGGHGYTTSLSGVKGALNIDLSKFRKVVVDASANTMTIGAATIFADMLDPLYAAGKQMPSGGSSTPSIIGVTLGGGIGPLTGAHGLLIDSLLSVEMVTGSGQILTVSATKNSDLFWGMRGAGVNFGIVTSATYRIYDTINNGMVYNADISFDGEKNETIFKILRSYQGTQDNKLAISVASSVKNKVPEISISVIYFGTKEQGDAAIKAFLDQQPTFSNISVVPYNKLVYVANFGGDVFARIKGVRADLWGYQLNDVTVSTLSSTYTKFINFVLDNPALENPLWLVEKFGLGVTATIPDESTAYAWRKAVAYGFFSFNLPANVSEQMTNTVDQFSEKIRSGLTSGCGNPQGNVFPNYARGIETPEQVYGKSKLPKLRSLKKKYDPKGLFNKYNSFA
ncbi:hypothetical protein COCCADRAFT_35010 [Bipolaris zeicola 26-R-13]|uniref:FAD-binding PCMH-type domain-containing protein n=1 Tax=Cochliobolus carbonum (strain 26-R-13) TaxID=930089 RepID=W6YVK3_COCC2|nr:uncharacterized protein COCCADRAFT_35010 [Bipolaris zeicola 26-R-13]EUC35506.1 hypothetical protein COCCADRAFT_35010 [Bipolaris zeicola 26-R-13]